MKTLLFMLLLISQAFAVSEENYRQLYGEKVAPYFKTFQSDSFRNQQNMRIHFYALKKSSSKKTLIIIPGRTEAALKYAEVAYDLKELGMNVFILDIQGQGESDRLLADTQKGHVRYFNDYVTDLKQFITEVVIPSTPQNEYFLLSHSMGGAISAKMLASTKLPIKKMVLNSPMLQINTDPYPEWVALPYAQILVFTGKGASYAPGKGSYVPAEDTFEKNTVTHSKVRFFHNKKAILDEPGLIVSGPTSRWVGESLKATAFSKYWGKKISIPILMFQAEDDQVVHLDRQTQFCQLAPNCKSHLFSHANHEILMEKDSIREEALSQIKNFLK
jgi:lysophospholipase